MQPRSQQLFAFHASRTLRTSQVRPKTYTALAIRVNTNVGFSNGGTSPFWHDNCRRLRSGIPVAASIAAESHGRIGRSRLVGATCYDRLRPSRVNPGRRV